MANVTTLGERLSELRGRESRENAAKRLGVHENTLFKYEKDKRTPDAGFLSKVAGRYGVALEWLLEGKGGKFGGVAEEPVPFRPDDQPGGHRQVEIINVPIFDVRAGAGSGQVAEDEEPMGCMPLPRALLIKRGINPKGAAMAFATGVSMRPTLDDGDPYIFDRMDVEPRDEIFLMKRAGELIVKQLQRKSDGSLVLISHNPTYEPEPLPRDDADSLEIIGRVGMVLRSL